MRNLLRAAAWTAAVSTALYVGAALIVPRVVVADAWRGRIEERLTAIAGRPVGLGRLRLSLWTGIVVTADRLTVSGTPSIAATSVSVGLAWGPLLRREVRPRWIAAGGASIRRGSASLVESSSLRARIGTEAGGATRIDGRIQGTVTALRDGPAGEVVFEAAATGDRLDVRSFVARVGGHVIEARAVIGGIRGPAQRIAVSGSARVAGITFSAIDAEVLLERGLAKLERASFRSHGGTGNSRGVVRLGEPGMPFRIETGVENVSVESLAAGSSPATAAPIEGTLTARLELAGLADAPSAASRLEGTAQVEIVRGSIRSVGLLEQAARVLEIAGGRGLGKNETPFDTIAATFALSEGAARTSDLRFRSPDLDLDGGGTVGLDGKLELDVVAGFSRAASGAIAGRTPQVKFRIGSDGRLTIPMNIRGSIRSPAVQIDLERVLQEGLQKELREHGKPGWLRKLLGRTS